MVGHHPMMHSGAIQGAVHNMGAASTVPMHLFAPMPATSPSTAHGPMAVAAPPPV